MSPVRPCLAPSAPPQTARARAPRRAQRAPARRRRRRAAGAAGVAHPRPNTSPRARLPFSPAPSGRQPAPKPVPSASATLPAAPYSVAQQCLRACRLGQCVCSVRASDGPAARGGVGGQSIAVAEGACRPSNFRPPSVNFPPKLKLAPCETPGGEMRGSECACSRDGWLACDPSEWGAREISRGNFGFRRAAIERSVKCPGGLLRTSPARAKFSYAGTGKCEALNWLQSRRRIASHCRGGQEDFDPARCLYIKRKEMRARRPARRRRRRRLLAVTLFQAL